jgi:hypothetical protein
MITQKPETPTVERRKVFFLMVTHPLKGRIRVGTAHNSRESAAGWRSFVSDAWHRLPVHISACTLHFVDGALTPQSIKILDQKYNLDPPEAKAAQ